MPFCGLYSHVLLTELQHARPAGFAIFRSPLKEESEPALRMLRESRHQLVMITGACMQGFCLHGVVVKCCARGGAATSWS